MKLNDLQINIVALVNQGKTNKEIADQLGYSEVYIKKNLQTCFKYFKVKNRVEMVREVNLLEH